jgi:hypothetical protein
VSFPGNLTPEQLMQRFSSATDLMRKHDTAIQASIAAGDMERAEAIRAEYEKKKPQYERLRLFVHQYRQMLVMKQNAGVPPCTILELSSNTLRYPSAQQPTNDVATPQFPLGSGNNVPTGNTNPPMPPQPVANHEITQVQPNFQMNEMHSSTSNPSMNAMSNPNVQMQKMMEQKHLQHQLGTNTQSAGGVGMQNPNSMATPFAAGGENIAQMGPQSMARPPGPVLEWTGTLKCNGQGPNGMREMQCNVNIAFALAPEKAYDHFFYSFSDLGLKTILGTL